MYTIRKLIFDLRMLYLVSYARYQVFELNTRVQTAATRTELPGVPGVR